MIQVAGKKSSGIKRVWSYNIWGSHSCAAEDSSHYAMWAGKHERLKIFSRNAVPSPSWSISQLDKMVQQPWRHASLFSSLWIWICVDKWVLNEGNHNHLKICIAEHHTTFEVIWSDFDRASSLLCGNKMPTRCNRWYLLQIFLHAQHVSGNTMPIIRNSRVLYRWLLPVVFGALFFRLSVWCGAEGYVSGLQAENWKTKHQIPQAATICIILSSSWWWA